MCVFCGRIVLADRYDAHIEALCTIKCACGLLVRGRFFKEHQNTAMHRKQIVEKQAKIGETFSTLVKEGAIKPVKLPWKPLPPGEHPFSDIVEHYRRLQQRNPQVEYETQRLNKVYELHPGSIYIGVDEFEGYVVFYFDRKQVAVLECPLVGNAIYVIKSNWKTLSRLSKAQLLRHHQRDVVRIVHTGDWFAKLLVLFAQIRCEGQASRFDSCVT
jgi:hypothetical protein